MAEGFNPVEFLMNGFAAGFESGLTWKNAIQGAFGDVLGREAGSSQEFMDFRSYLPGDDLRRLDWNVYARTDNLIVKMYQNEIRPHVDILLDFSKSMGLFEWKRQRLFYQAGFYAGASQKAGMSHAFWSIDSGSQSQEQSGELLKRSSYEQWINNPETIPLFDGCRSMGEILCSPNGMRNNSGNRILISDLLFPEDPATIAAAFRDTAPGRLIVEILAKEELHPTISGNCRLIDCEMGNFYEYGVDKELLEEYEKKLSVHRDRWRQACRTYAISLISDLES